MAELAPRTAKEYVAQRYEKGIHAIQSFGRDALVKSISDFAIPGKRPLGIGWNKPGQKNWITLTGLLALDGAGSHMLRCQRKHPDLRFRIYRPNHTWLTAMKRGKARFQRGKILQRELT